ncbi:hypothetical protein H9L14_09530 [Sphingomonas sediminicola]|uniref:Type II toxin-antitoxin system RelE/ParE family toxin n=1 Tax=Sphingomonas sediminicola TaxID=386874 RepID=A0ABX6T539_9SPHN|nr:hypothetical protein [Sphingomonas sediminicola]QNP44959.1 hypothetical protein H9L14_09530 [Sphingomonas sediminicola]
MIEDVDPLGEIDRALNRFVADDIPRLEKGGSPRRLDIVKFNAFSVNQRVYSVLQVEIIQRHPVASLATPQAR